MGPGVRASQRDGVGGHWREREEEAIGPSVERRVASKLNHDRLASEQRDGRKRKAVVQQEEDPRRPALDEYGQRHRRLHVHLDLLLAPVFPDRREQRMLVHVVNDDGALGPDRRH